MPYHSDLPFLPVSRSVRLPVESGEWMTAVTRTELEAGYGWWSDAQLLAEDGRATRLGPLPEQGAVILTRTGDLLTVHPIPDADLYRARVFAGRPESMWSDVSDAYPGVWPGHAKLPRYWVLQDGPTPFTRMYGVFDLFTFAVLGWCADHREARRAAAAMTHSTDISVM